MLRKVLCLSLLLITTLTSADVQERGISRLQLENWASKFGGPLFEFGQSVTKYNELLGRFQNSRESKVEQIKLENMLPEMTKEIVENFEGRVDAIQKLVNAAENRALEWATSGSSGRRRHDEYLNAKDMKADDVSLNYEPLFDTKVNPDMSSVHVPTSIYEKDEQLLEALEWSSVMDETFRSNRAGHPSLYWQYFGSSVGFMRQYPGAPWPNSSNDVPDLYDCRFRPWYIGAANRPKNVVILLDVSGSMTGQRREIARHVVYTILDTLTENDYVAVFNFSSEVTAVLPCFNKTLVQANLEYIREIKEALDQEKTTGVADFPLALNHAFDVLEQGVKEKEWSAGCNNAIMLVTDGAPYNYKEVFEARQNQLNPVRIFTYLTGKEVTDFREVRWMACNNKGYFVHISTLSEVQEQVLKYLPVMSRPLVMLGRHDIYWTPIYADLVVQQHRVNRKMDSPPNFVISASIPVFDLRNSSGGGGSDGGEKPIGDGTTVQIPQLTLQERIAKFLGVVATDIPLKELKRLVKPFRLGVNGYAFIVNNNGHVVLHPDWRPMFEDILKPNYNTVDMAEVELMDSNHSGRNNDSLFLEMRGEIVRHERNYRTLRVRVHQDQFRRVGIRSQHYEYTRLGNTPYTLVLVTPDMMNRFHGEIELYLSQKEGHDVTTYFDDPHQKRRHWTVNPNWHYCEYLQTEDHFDPRDKEDLVLHFLKELRLGERHASGWKWRNTGVGLKKQRREDRGRDIYECDKDLMQALVFDANVTDIFSSTKLWKFNKNQSTLAKLFALMPRQIIEIYGAALAFIATRSGLTRWMEFDEHHPKHMQFVHATDELMYQRAVDRYAYDPDSFVFSVPIHDPKTQGQGPLNVTATRAIFVSKNGRKAPVAVVGIQFDHTKFQKNFMDITSVCMDNDRRLECEKTCASPEFQCFVLDDNGYILINDPKKPEDVGKFFGQVNGMVMEMLINSDVYKRVRVVDYQAVCLRPASKTSLASILLTPLIQMRSVMWWVVGQLASLTFNIGLDTLLNPSWGEAVAQYLEEDDDEVVGLSSTEPPSVSKTKLRPCDMEYELYTYGPSYNTYNFSYFGLLTKCGHNCDGYFNVHYIPHTNLILVVTDGRCDCTRNHTTLAGKEVEYPSGETDGETPHHHNVETCTRPKLQLTRSPPSACVQINPEESEIHDCGGGASVRPLSVVVVILWGVGRWLTS